MPATLHALRLSRHELLLELTKNPASDKVSLFHLLQEILGLIKSNGHFLIDEVDSVLRCTDETHFTLQEAKEIPFNLFEKACRFNQAFIKLAEEKKIATKEDFEREKEAIIELACEHAKGLLQAAQIRLFLEDKAAIKDITAEDLEFLSFLKGAIQHWLPFCIHQIKELNFGLSKESPDKLYAIPYLGNNQANERADFSNEHETLLYTMLVYRKSPPSIKHLQNWLKNLKTKVQKERANKGLSAEMKSPLVQRFKKAFKDKSFDQFDENDSQDLQDLQDAFQTSDELLYFYLEDAVYPQIQIHTKRLSSYGVSLAEMPKSLQGFTGTLYNGLSYHEHLSRNLRPQRKPIVDLKETLKEKTKRIFSVPMTALDNFIEALLGEELGEKRALIDIGAQFAGFSNLSVVQGLAKHFLNKQMPIEGILYYDEENKLHLYEIQTNKSIGPLGTELKELDQRFDRTKLFSYYDQIHTRGCDIKQNLDAVAIVCVGHKTTDCDFCQGVMRMRQIQSGAQSIEICLSKPLEETLESGEESSIEELIAHFEKVEQEKEKNENFRALKQKIRNQMQRIVDAELDAVYQKLGEENFEEFCKRINSSAVLAFYQEDCEKSLFEQYGQKTKLINTEKLIEQYLMDWKEKTLLALQALGREDVEAIKAYIMQEGLSHLHELKGHIPEQVLANDQALLGQEMQCQKEQELQKETECQTELQIQLEEFKQKFSSEFVLRDYRPSFLEHWKSLLQNLENDHMEHLRIARDGFEELFEEQGIAEEIAKDFFPKELFLSLAAAYYFSGKQEIEPIFFSSHARALPFLAWVDGGEQSLIVLDSQDAMDLWNAMQAIKKPELAVSLCLSDGRLLKGAAIAEDKKEQFEELVFKAALLRGDFEYLRREEDKLCRLLNTLSRQKALELLESIFFRASFFYESTEIINFFNALLENPQNIHKITIQELLATRREF